jgi:NSS family neurotransmitter:Na+ symporter
MDFLSNQVLLPLGGILIAIFVAWVMKREHVLDELEIKEGWLLNTWFILLKFLSPLMVGIVFVAAVFLGVT